MKNQFASQFDQNIKLSYTSFDRVILRGYIRRFFSIEPGSEQDNILIIKSIPS